MSKKKLLITGIILVLSVNAMFGGLPGANFKKSLPLDKLPDAIFKSRENSHYLPDRIIVKLHDSPPASVAPGTFGVSAVDKFVQRYNAESVNSLFPARTTTAFPTKADGEMARIFVLKYSSPIDPFQIAKEISQLPDVDYAEPWFIYAPDEVTSFTPNDSSYSKQWGFAKVKADSAWGVTHGDTSVVIGIIDTGVQWNHPDLNANIWTNPGETGLDINGIDKRLNGVDDDGNGFKDDWHGVDLAGGDFNNPLPDDNPSPTGSNTAHGTHVAGIAGAATNNLIGVAGMGFKCKILPVKTSADNDTRSSGSAYIIMGFEGIKYAVDMGAKIINCSWGGGGASQLEQDVIDYAVSHGSVVVAAAGNSNSSAPHYPAAYAGVFSVAATTTTDSKATYSNYGTSVDVSAPGGLDGGNPVLWIFSTYYPNTYSYMSGTSMASPLAAGVIGLVKSLNPSYSGVQAAEQVRVSCDNIAAQNPLYANLLGKGRVNAYRAVTLSSPSLRMTSFATSDAVGGNNNGALEPNETFTVVTDIINYLQSTSPSATITLTTVDTTVQIINGVFPIGALSTNNSANNSSSPFQVLVKNNIPPAHLLTFSLVISDGAYNDFQLFSVILNPTFADHNINNVTTTLTNVGRIGYLDITNTYGSGFIYSNVNELFEGGLLVGYSATKIVDDIRSPDCSVCQDNDFVSSQIYNMVKPGTLAQQEGSTIYTDVGAPLTNKIGIQVNQYSYAYITPPDSDYVIIRYDITNTTAGTLSGVYTGVFIDWDMQPNINNNKTIFESGRSLGYAWDTTASNPNPLYCGLRALDSAAGFRGLEVLTADISRSSKYSWISGGVISPVMRGDVHMVLSSGPYTIAAGKKQIVGFAMMGGKNLAQLQTHADAAKAKWDGLKPLLGVEDKRPGIPGEYALLQNYPNPFNPSTTIYYDLPLHSRVTLKVYDILGRVVSTLADREQEAGKYSVEFNGSGLASGVYFYRLEAIGGNAGSIRQFSGIKKLMFVK